MDRRFSNPSLDSLRRYHSHASPSESPSDSDFRAPKRPRLSNTNTPGSFTSTSNLQTQSDEDDPIDLTESEGPSALSKALSKQREDAVRAQQVAEHENGRSLLTAYKCPVCMDTPVDATSTACGMH